MGQQIAFLAVIKAESEATGNQIRERSQQHFTYKTSASTAKATGQNEMRINSISIATSPLLSSLFWSANLSIVDCLNSKEGDGKDGEKERRRADS